MAKALINTAGISQLIRRGSRGSGICLKVLASRSRKASKVKHLRGLMAGVYRLAPHFSRTFRPFRRLGAQVQKLFRLTQPVSAPFSSTENYCLYPAIHI